MAQEPYLLDPETLDPVYDYPLYDPRYKRHRRRSRARYDPRRRRRSRARRMYDPRRRYLTRLRPGRRAKSVWAKLWKGINTTGPVAVGVGAAIWTASAPERGAAGAGWNNLTGVQKLTYTLNSAISRFTFGMVKPNIGNSGGAPPASVTYGWNWTKALTNTPFLASLGAYAASYLPILPHRGTVKKLAKAGAIGSFLGGGVDPSYGPTTGKMPGPQITRPATAPLGARSTYNPGPVPSSLSGGLPA